MVHSISSAAPVTPQQGHNPGHPHSPAPHKPGEIKDTVQLSDQAKASLEIERGQQGR